MPVLKEYEGQRFLELGCEPGKISAAIAAQINFQFHGVDFLQDCDHYLKAMTAVGVEAVRMTSDFRDVPIQGPYDVVASFGLIEHFENPMEVMAAHDRCLRSGRLLVITLPNFRGLQFVYGRLFDLTDLRFHNLAVMEPQILKLCGQELGHEIIKCQHMGKLCFWGFDRSSSKLRLAARALGAVCARIYAVLCGPLLPDNHPWFGPYIIYVARKRGTRRL